MKTILLKDKFILAMILIATSFSQVIYAQSSSDENFEMQGFTLEFNSVKSIIPKSNLMAFINTFHKFNYFRCLSHAIYRSKAIEYKMDGHA